MAPARKKRTGVNKKPQYASCAALQHTNVKMGRKKCRIDWMSTLVNELSEVQKGYVADIGFETLLGMKIYNKSELPDKLTWWLVSLVDVRSRTLKLGNVSINIDNMVPKVLGVPYRGTKVEPLKINDCDDELKCQLTTQGKGLPTHILQDKIKYLEDKKLFSIHFMLLALCYYLAPNTTYCINRDYLTTLRDVDRIKGFNWCEHIADILISGIKKFKKETPVYMPGCVHILHLIFNHVHENKFTDSGTLLIHSVSEEDLQNLVPPNNLITPGSVEVEETCSTDADSDGDDLIHVVSKIIEKGLLDNTCCRKAKQNITNAKLHQVAQNIIEYVRGVEPTVVSLSPNRFGPSSPFIMPEVLPGHTAEGNLNFTSTARPSQKAVESDDEERDGKRGSCGPE